MVESFFYVKENINKLISIRKTNNTTFYYG